MDWFHGRQGNVGLRLGGALLVLVACVAVRRLLHLAQSAGPAFPGAVAYLLATIGFLCGSVGTALTVLGSHLFDRVEVSARW